MRRVQDLETENASLRERFDALEAENASQRERLDALEALVTALAKP